MPSTSIQSFFSSTSPLKSSPGDGFTPEELTLPTPTTDWTPTLAYDECSIGALETGPRNLALMGRVVNTYDMPKPSKRPTAAQGYIKITLADDTGAMTVRLWYAKTRYNVRLGQLVSVWTVHISFGAGEHTSLAPSAAPLFTTIFPEGERHCHFMVHGRSDDGTMFRKPFGVRDERVLPGLMTLRNFTEGGYDVEGCKLLVCVKSIGARKKCECKMASSLFDQFASGANVNLQSPTKTAPPQNSSPSVSSTTQQKATSLSMAQSPSQPHHGPPPKPYSSLQTPAGASTALPNFRSTQTHNYTSTRIWQMHAT